MNQRDVHGSVVVDGAECSDHHDSRTRQKEEANFLAINLANDIATGKRDVNGAREHYAKAMMQMMKEGTKDPYLTGFKFDVPRSYTGDPDKPADMVGTTGKKPGR